MGDKIDEMRDLIMRALDELGLDSTNVGYSSNCNSFSNLISFRQNWEFTSYDAGRCSGNYTELICLVRHKQLGALVSLKAFAEKEARKLGMTI